MELLEQKDVTIGDCVYDITALPASYGMGVMDRLMGGGDVKFSVTDMKQIILKSVKINNKSLDEKRFDVHFSRKYAEMTELFNEIMSFNFGELDPNDSGDVSEEGGISE